jgi:formylglycine-generating enzyme required for sulfatase activity
LSWQTPGYPQDDRHPVACLSFDDAKAYVAWLSGRTGESYRLLTDAEWHFIASSPDVPEERGAGQCRFANGADRRARDAEPGWTTADCSDGYHHTAPVGSFAPTGAGLGDLFGNLWEWVDSCEPDFSGATPVFRPCGRAAPRILRGGSWSDRPELLVLDARILSPPEVRDQIAGVRIAREVPSCDTGAAACPPDIGAPKTAPKISAP